MYKYIVFDVDGTMVDTEKVVNDAYQCMIFEKYGRHFTDEEMMKGYGVPTRKTLETYGFTDIDKALEEYHKYLIEGYVNNSSFDGIVVVLDELKKRDLTLAIVTSRTQREIEIDPCLQGILGLFDKVVNSEETVLHKPNPEPLLKAVEKLDADPSQTLYIGDTVFDAQCAKNAGIKFGLALWGSNNAENINADYYLKKPEDILKII